MPLGPYNLWPEMLMRSMLRALTSTGTLPTACAASVWKNTCSDARGHTTCSLQTVCVCVCVRDPGACHVAKEEGSTKPYLPPDRIKVSDGDSELGAGGPATGAHPSCCGPALRHTRRHTYMHESTMHVDNARCKQ